MFATAELESSSSNSYTTPTEELLALTDLTCIIPSTRTATAGSDVVQSGSPIFDDFFQHLWPYIGNNTANVVFQMVKRLWHRPMTLHSPTENSLAVLNHKRPIHRSKT
ncbi:hypothetical protein TNCV_4168351 [Trichonephila clavipes]|nr:hypothetical protein TNCV_4168351 [Trichonephila clavipes]